MGYLRKAATEHDVLLQVGHIERFNPAVQTLNEILETKDVYAIEAHRLGPFSDHLNDESVVFDLMIHDIDVVNSLVSGELAETNVFGASPRSKAIDHAVALLKFGNDVLVTTTASHVTHGKIRTMNVTTEDAYISLDYQQQEIIVQRRGVGQTEPLLNQSGYRTETITESPYINTREPLKMELEHFLSCCRTRSEPRVNGTDGVQAVKIATGLVSQLASE
jgi:predicted dehydrogenase